MEMNKYFKKITAVAVAVSVLSVMASCAPKTEETAAPQLISGGTAATVASKEGKESAAATKPSGDSYSITYKGTVLTPGMDTTAAIKALGEGYIYNKVMSCAFNGMEETYDYKEIVIFADDHDGKNKINTIEVKDPSIDCGGVKLGSSLDDVRKAFGDPTAEELYGLRYEKGHTQIQFIAGEDKTLSSILFKAI